ncbi:MAG: hypothetical protein WB799_12685 [Candidatus Sulfotelmatobacter sp.]
MGSLIVKRIAVHLSCIPREIGVKHLPRVPEDVELGQLELETRTHNCIDRPIRAGAIHNIRGLSNFTIDKAKHIKGLGARGLVDLLVALESAMEQSALPSEGDRDTGRQELALVNRLTNEAKKLSRLRSSSMIRVDDPRLRRFLMPVLNDVKRILGPSKKPTTLRGLADAIVNRKGEIDKAALHVQNLHSMREQLHKMRRSTLEAELRELVLSVTTERTATMFLRMYGWDGRGGATLQQVGSEVGCTRERVRQICAPVTDRLVRTYMFLPVLDRALPFVSSSVPRLADDLEEMLVEEGICNAPFRLEGLLEAAQILDRPVEFEVIETGGVRLGVSNSTKDLGKKILHLAKRAVEHWGTTTIESVTDQVNAAETTAVSAQFVTSFLGALNDFVWLDKDHGGWFWLNSVSRNRILNQVFKILSIAPRIRLSDLRSGVSRHYRLEGFSPPRRVLSELCGRQSGIAVDGEFVTATIPLDPSQTLSGVEATLARVLVENGPIMRRGDFEELSIKAGLTRVTFYMYLSNSPILAKFASGVYGLRGAQAEPGVVEALVPKAKTGKVLADYGWTRDGKIWLRYKLSASMILTGVCTIPGSMKDLITGDYVLKTADGTKAGRVGAKDGRGWGLAPLLRKSGGEPGDSTFLIFNLQTRDVVMNFGDDAEPDETDFQSGVETDLPSCDAVSLKLPNQV